MLNISIGIWLCLLIIKLYSQKLFSNYFRCGSVKTTHYGTQSIKYLAPKIWDLVPGQIKHCGSLTKFRHLSSLGQQVTVLAGYTKHILYKKASLNQT